MTAQAFEIVDETLVRALAAGRTISRAAKAARVSESTVYRRLREPDFQDRLSEIRAGVIETARNRIANRTLDACDTLTRLLASQSESTQIRAAKTFIELAVKLHSRDLHPELSDPNELPQTRPESLSAATPDQHTVPQEPDPVRSEPVDSSRPVTPSPEIAAKQEEHLAAPDTFREPVASPASVNGRADSGRDSRPVDLPSSLLAAGEGGRPSKTARDLSKPVKTCHRPAGHRPVNEVNRLSAGLTAALAGIGVE